MKLIQIGGVYVNPERVTFLENANYGDFTSPVTRIWFGPDDHVKVLYRIDEVAQMLGE